MNCSGKRDATEKVQKKNMGDRMLLSGEFLMKRRDGVFMGRKVINLNGQSKINLLKN